MYPTQATQENEWIRTMLEAWRDSGKSHLCFPYARFFPRQLVSIVEKSEAFWLYTYYRNANKSNDFIMGGQVRFRFHVIDWDHDRFEAEHIHVVDFSHLDETIWFLCDHAVEIMGSDGEMLTLRDFEHPEGKRLASTMRSTIPPVEFDKEVEVIQAFPAT
jgi:hypothetical protein